MERNSIPASLSISSSSVKVCKEFNWDADGRDMEMVRRETAAADATGRRARTFRVALDNVRRCMMIRRERKGGDGGQEAVEFKLRQL